jgi:hypothetical protein
MYTLVDFTTRVKGAEYLLAITAIALFVFFSEILKKNPFKSLIDAGREDIKYVKENGLSIAKLMAAPFTGLLYVISIPFSFVLALATALINGLMRMAGGSAALSWRPAEAYLSGHKKTKKRDADRNRQTEKK